MADLGTNLTCLFVTWVEACSIHMVFVGGRLDSLDRCTVKTLRAGVPAASTFC
jgi:hypothetical protein